MTDSELMTEIIAMARSDMDPTAAFRKIRSLGGRDLTKDDEEFHKLYMRIKAQPLFAANMLLTMKRAEFQRAVIDGMLSCTPASDNEVDDLMRLIDEFEKGSLRAMLACIEHIADTNPVLASSLMTTARKLWPAPFAQKDAQDAAAAARAKSAQLELPFPAESVEPAPVPELCP